MVCFESTKPWLLEQLLAGGWAQEQGQVALRDMV